MKKKLLFAAFFVLQKEKEKKNEAERSLGLIREVTGKGCHKKMFFFFIYIKKKKKKNCVFEGFANNLFHG